MERLEVSCLLSAGGRAAPVGRPRWAREMVGFWLRLVGAGFLCPWRGRAGLFFPTRGKEPKGAQWQPIRASTMAAPGPLVALFGGRNLLLREANCFLAGAACSGFRGYVCHPQAAGRHRWAALVARGLVGLSGDGYCVWTDKEDKARFSAMVHDRRSMSSLRRPPQEVAASLNHGGARKPHAKRGDRRGAPPELAQPRILPRRGRCHGESRDG